VNPRSNLNPDLTPERGLPAPLRGEDDPVAAFEQAGHQPVVLGRDGMQERVELQRLAGVVVGCGQV
jgi:hypothetical protein